MKQVISILLFTMLFPVMYAKTFRVNNNTGIQNVYATLQAAVGVASNGDTIHIEGSLTPYTGNVVIAKKLVIIGPGYFLENAANTQYLKQSAKINHNITFEAGSEESVLAGIEHFSKGQGTDADYSVNIDRNTAYLGNRVVVNANSIKITNCKLFFLEIKNDKPLSKISVEKCFFNPGLIKVSGNQLTENISISNNFFRNNWTGDSGVNYMVIWGTGGANPAAPTAPQSNWLIQNNTFYAYFNVHITNTRFVNNALYGLSAGVGLVNADNTNAYNNNVTRFAVAGMADGVNGNTIRTEAEDLWFSKGGNSVALDSYYTSANNTTTCPLRDVVTPGNDTKAKGMYGGGVPYVFSGMFKIPSVYDIQMASEVGEQFDMTIKASVH